ncbi:HOOK2 protein, partial [Struthidea cinerea]|nr:HOOK2 protein [Struthidea cinerea]
GFRGSTRSPPQKPSVPPGDPPGTPPLAPPPETSPQSDWERSRAQREREERLLVTAWYNMGLALQQQEGGPAPRGLPSGAQSFLAQQRLATVARRARTPHGRAPSS